MTRTHAMLFAASALSLILLHAQAMAGTRAVQAATSCACDDPDATTCESRITNADGEDGKDNSGPNSGNGGKGGKIKNADKCSGKASANGGNGGDGNRGANSGNGGKGGKISF